MSFTQASVTRHSRSNVNFFYWLRRRRVIERHPMCIPCGRPMTISPSTRFVTDGVEWRCRRCRRRKSIRSGTMWSQYSNLSVMNQLRLLIAFEAGATATSTGSQWEIGRHAVGLAFQHFRRIIQGEWRLNVAGGQENFTGTPIEIDCMTITNVRDDVNNMFLPVIHILGIFEYAPAGGGHRIRLHRVGNQAAATLVPLIRASVPNGSYIFTDSHLAFNTLNNFPYFHFTVNHSIGEYARDAVDLFGNNIRVSTNHIEHVWARLRPLVSKSYQRRTSHIDLVLDVLSYRESGHSVFDPWIL